MKALLFSLCLTPLMANASLLYHCDLHETNGDLVGRATIRVDPLLVKIAKTGGAEETLADEHLVYKPKPVKLAECRIVREGDESASYVRWSKGTTADGSLYINGAFLRGSFLSSYGLVGVPTILEYRFENCDPQ